MVTLDGNLSNPLDQKLHTLLGHFQYISPITTIIYTSHSFTQPRTLHNQHNNILHTTYHIQQPNYIHQQPIHSITWSCTHACRFMQSNLVDFPYLCCLWLCINQLIPDWSYFSVFFLSDTTFWQALQAHDMMAVQFSSVLGGSIVFHGFSRPAQIPHSG